MSCESSKYSVNHQDSEIKTSMDSVIQGPLGRRAEAIQEEINMGMEKQFQNIVKANIGDCHMMGQKPITFIRQLLALLSYPQLMEDSKFPEDVKTKAQIFLEACNGNSVGAYTYPKGLELIRKHAARYIEHRDGITADWENIILSSGATDGIRGIIHLLQSQRNCRKTGVLVPYPQYPVYTALLTEYDMKKIGYFLNEDDNWSLEIADLKHKIAEARKECSPKAIVVINPGNPTGQVLSRENMEDIVKFAHNNELYILADEVYQHNIYIEAEFHSFKKVVSEMEAPYNTVKLASFMSGSKGYMGECGLRAGYVEMLNVPDEAKQIYFNNINVNLCPNVFGQAVLYSIFNEPQKGDPSYKLFIKEKTELLESLKLRAKMVYDVFNTFEEVRCNPIQGAMYAFPEIKLPLKALEAARERKLEPDEFYSLELLNATGVLVVPGSGFGQKEGTFHFRTTILPQPEVLKVMLERCNVFHKDFRKQYQ